jgi:hypothetical protein
MVSVRFRDETRENLERQAKISGRPLSQEIEYRVEQSLERRRLDRDLMEAVYGAQLGALLAAMATAAYQPMMSIRFLQRAHGAPEGVRGLRDPRTYDEAAKAIVAILERMRPEGVPADLHVELELGRRIVDGTTSAQDYLADLLRGAFKHQEWVKETLSDLTASKGKEAP